MILVLLLAVLVASLPACTIDDGTSSPGPSASPPGRPDFAADVRFALDFYLDTHPRPFFAVGPNRLRERYEAVEARADSLSRSELLVELMRLAALPGRKAGRDGHSGVFPLDGHDPPLRLLPLRLYWFPEGIFVVDALAGYEELVGTQVTAIAETPIAEAIEAVEPLVSRDNLGTLKARLPQVLVVGEVLEGLRISSDATSAWVVFESPEETVARQVGTVSADAYARGFGFDHPMIPPSLPAAPAPLYLRNADLSWWATYLERQDALYVQYNRTLGDTTVFADRVTTILRRRRPARVVVDVRHNPGGDNTTYGPLLGALTHRLADRSELSVLMGRSTFSAAGHFVLDLRRRARVLLAGQPSGFSPNQFGDPRATRLEASGFRLQVATIWWRTSPLESLAVRPALRRPLTAAEFFALRDPLLDAVLRRGRG